MSVKNRKLTFKLVVTALLLPVIACVLCKNDVCGNETNADKDKIVARFLSREVGDCTIKLQGKYRYQ